MFRLQIQIQFNLFISNNLHDCYVCILQKIFLYFFDKMILISIIDNIIFNIIMICKKQYIIILNAIIFIQKIVNQYIKIQESLILLIRLLLINLSQ